MGIAPRIYYITEKTLVGVATFIIALFLSNFIIHAVWCIGWPSLSMSLSIPLFILDIGIGGYFSYAYTSQISKFN